MLMKVLTTHEPSHRGDDYTVSSQDTFSSCETLITQNLTILKSTMNETPSDTLLNILRRLPESVYGEIKGFFSAALEYEQAFRFKKFRGIVLADPLVDDTLKELLGRLDQEMDFEYDIAGIIADPNDPTKIVERESNNRLPALPRNVECTETTSNASPVSFASADTAMKSAMDVSVSSGDTSMKSAMEVDQTSEESTPDTKMPSLKEEDEAEE